MLSWWNARSRASCRDGDDAAGQCCGLPPESRLPLLLPYQRVGLREIPWEPGESRTAPP